MFLIRCPYCGERDLSDFAYGGEAHIARPADSESMSNGEWGNYVFVRTNPKGPHAERWNHQAGCRRWFNMLRNTATDEILAVYRIGEPRPELNTSPAPKPDPAMARDSGIETAHVARPGDGGADAA